MMLLLYISQ